ncbi:TPCN2 [Bugula neritina]|uniref:TPCN2 n=1 Tax=Bugula neritina TaxID=10212 RepID=A0A7J7KQH9_BUGNE|nr:TPCN2 [Bugula neritina]
MTSGFQPSRLLSSQRNGLTDSDSQPDLDFMYDKNTINQAAIFIEDAIKYRSIFHKIDDSSLKLYRFFYSKTVQWGIHCTVFLIHILAFFERPSSITFNWSSDLTKVGHRWVAPCGLLQAVELLCLMVLLLEQLLKTHFIGWKRVKTSKWIIAAYIVCMFSISDCLVSVFLQCSNKVRVRRMLRPFFVIQRSTMMKKVWNCLRRTFPDIASVLLLLLAHLYFFTLFGMLLFPTPRVTLSPTIPASPAQEIRP